MAHFRHEDRHPRALVAVIQAELHLVALCIERRDVVVKLVARNEESFELPFYSHEKHALHLVHILVEIDDVSLIIRNKFRNLRNDTLLIRAM